MNERDYNESFSKNFITNIAFEIRFIPLIRITELIPKFQEKIRTKLSHYEVGFPYKMDASSIPPELNEWLFSTKEKDMVLKIALNRLSYIETSYANFKSFISKPISYIKIFNELTKINEFTRTGIRFKNEYLLNKEKPIDDLLSNFNTYMNLEILNARKPESFGTEFRWNDGKTKITCWNYLQKDDKNVKYIIDIDAYSDKVIDISDLTKTNEILHKSAVTEFHRNITNNFLKILREKK